MTEISGYVEIPSVHLKTACKNYWAKRQENIYARKEKLIQEEMQRKGWFGSKKKTRVEIIESLKKSKDAYIISPWKRAENWGSYWAQKVEDLQDAACLGPTVLVDVNMASLLKPYFDPAYVSDKETK